MMDCIGSGPRPVVLAPQSVAVALLSDLPGAVCWSVLARSRVFVVGPDAAPDAVGALIAFAASEEFADRRIVFFGGAEESVDLPSAAAVHCNFIRADMPRPGILWIAAMLATSRDEPAPPVPVAGWNLEGQFRIRTLDDVECCVRLLSDLMLFEVTTSIGFRELAVNAIEHGNLGITFADKSALLQRGEWYTEILRRLALPEYSLRYATVDFALRAGRGEIRIVDQGTGFDWRRYMAGEDPAPGGHHGRGISMAIAGDFDAVTYFGRGNDVLMTFSKSAPSRS